MKTEYANWKESHSLIREYLTKYKGPVLAGVFALVVVDAVEIIPPLLIKRGIELAEGDLSRTNLEREVFQLALALVGVTLLQSLGRYAWRVFLIRSSNVPNHPERLNPRQPGLLDYCSRCSR